jgi:hypothetical protein
MLDARTKLVTSSGVSGFATARSAEISSASRQIGSSTPRHRSRRFTLHSTSAIASLQPGRVQSARAQPMQSR